MSCTSTSSVSSAQVCSAVTAAAPRRCASARQARSPSDRPALAVLGYSTAAAIASSVAERFYGQLLAYGGKDRLGALGVAHEHRRDL